MNVIMKAVGSKWTEHKAQQQTQQKKQEELLPHSPRALGGSPKEVVPAPLPRRLSDEFKQFVTAPLFAATSAGSSSSSSNTNV